MNKINNKITFIFLVSTLILTNQNARETKKSTGQEILKSTPETLKNDPVKPKIEKQKPRIKKTFERLESDNMKLLNSLLAMQPLNVLRMKSSFKTAKNVQKELRENEKVEQKRIFAHRDKLLKPVKSFFDSLYDYQSLLKPLVVEILFEKEEKPGNEFSFLEFFDQPKEKARTFFHDTLVTREMLLKACQEFELLFGVVTASLSDEVIKGEQEIIAKIKAKRKKGV